MAVVSQYFSKQRTFAMGIVASVSISRRELLASFSSYSDRALAWEALYNPLCSTSLYMVLSDFSVVCLPVLGSIRLCCSLPCSSFGRGYPQINNASKAVWQPTSDGSLKSQHTFSLFLGMKSISRGRLNASDFFMKDRHHANGSIFPHLLSTAECNNKRYRWEYCVLARELLALSYPS